MLYIVVYVVHSRPLHQRRVEETYTMYTSGLPVGGRSELLTQKIHEGRVLLRGIWTTR